MSRLVEDIEKILQDARASREKTASQSLGDDSAPPNVLQESLIAGSLRKLAADLTTTSTKVSASELTRFLESLK
jgi:hypothetical protein